jgi:hypothetical protein
MQEANLTFADFGVLEFFVLQLPRSVSQKRRALACVTT